MRTLICLSLALASSASLAATPAAASLPPAYVASLARVQQQLVRVSDTVQACSQLHPQQAVAQRQALAAWRLRHQALLQEYERRYQGWLQLTAGGDRTRYVQYQRIMRDKAGQQRVRRLAELRAAGPAQSRTLCQTYVQHLAGDQLDPARLAAADLQQLRRLRPTF